MLKGTLIFAAIGAAFIGPLVYDGLAAPRNCVVGYDTSFNGLYILKQRHCYGGLGLPRNVETIERRPLFREF